MAHFNYTPLRNTALKLVKQFGKSALCQLLRTVEATPADPTMPWRVGAPTILQFNFIGVVSTVKFPIAGQPVNDDEKTIIVPGDIATTASTTDANVLCGDPTLLDRIQVASRQYGIIGIQDITPDADAFIYLLRCKAWPQILSQPPTLF